jgi:hypothetical protein
VTASNALVPHLSHRAAVYMVTTQTDADYIAIDPSTYRDFFLAREEQLREPCARDAGGRLRCGLRAGHDSRSLRVESTQQLTPELQRWLAGKCSGPACAP